MAFSLSKSFTSTAIGMAQDEGILSIDEPVLAFFPSLASDRIRENAGALTLRHLLSMTSGHAVDTFPLMTGLPNEDWVRLFLESPLEYPPGEHFLYNTGATFVLGAALAARSGTSITEFLTPRLFEPLGMGVPPWQRSSRGLEYAGSGMRLRTEDIASLAQLYLQRGRWNGDQLVSEEWVAQATSLQARNDQPDRTGDWAQGYGYQFWMSRHGFRGDGAFGQFCVVLPEQDAVIAITSGTDDLQGVLDAAWEHLLPGLAGGIADGSRSTEDAEGHDEGDDEALSRRLTDLRLPGPDAGTAPRPLPRFASATIDVPFNRVGVRAIRLDLAGRPEAWSMTLTGRDGRTETHAIGGDSWHQGQTEFWPHTELDVAATSSRGAWSEDGFRVVQQCTDTPFALEWRFTERAGGVVQVEVGRTYGPNGAVPERLEGTIAG
jgi:CubicO group peptidase (beta-lactamase class C family)